LILPPVVARGNFQTGGVLRSRRGRRRDVIRSSCPDFIHTRTARGNGLPECRQGVFTGHADTVSFSHETGRGRPRRSNMDRL